MTDSTSGPAFGPPTATERHEIEQVVAAYANGLADGDIKALMQVFWDHAVVSGYVGTEPFMEPVTFLYRFILDNGPGKPEYSWRPGDIAVAGKVAVATVYERNYLQDDYVTTLHLIHAAVNDVSTEPRWWIVSKLFDGVDVAAAST